MSESASPQVSESASQRQGSVAAPGFVGGVAEVLEGAALALGLAGYADLAAVVDELVGELNPAIFGDDFFEVLLDFDGVGVCGEFEAAREAEDVGVHNDAGGDAVPGAEDDVGGLAGDAGELEHLVHGLGDFAVEFFDENAGGADDALGFVAEEAGGLDELFDRSGVGFGEGVGSGELGEELGRDHVDADVCGLRGQDGGNGEFEGVAVIERADDVGVGLAKCVEDGANASGREGIFGFAGLELWRDGLAGGDFFCASGWDAFDGRGAFGARELLGWSELFCAARHRRKYGSYWDFSEAASCSSCLMTMGARVATSGGSRMKRLVQLSSSPVNMTTPVIRRLLLVKKEWVPSPSWFGGVVNSTASLER